MTRTWLDSECRGRRARAIEREKGGRERGRKDGGGKEGTRRAATTNRRRLGQVGKYVRIERGE